MHTRGFLGESRLAFESIVEEVRRFVARMPPADYSAGSACYLRKFSALGDQRAEILPVQRPRTLYLSARRMMRLTRILIFPYFSLSITDQLPPTSRGFSAMPRKTLMETRKGYTALTGQSTYRQHLSDKTSQSPRPPLPQFMTLPDLLSNFGN